MQQFCIKYCNSSPHVVEKLLYLGGRRIRSSVTLCDGNYVPEILTCWNLAPYLTKLHHWWHMSYIPSISEVLTKVWWKHFKIVDLHPALIHDILGRTFRACNFAACCAFGCILSFRIVTYFQRRGHNLIDPTSFFARQQESSSVM